MKSECFYVLCLILTTMGGYAQNTVENDKNEDAIHGLIDAYARARATKDTVLLNEILTDDIDQLVSTGEWRRSFETAKKGMLRSSSKNPGGRTLTVEQIRYLNSESAIADCRYEIANTDSSLRKMWSTFIVVFENDRWKITAIRNMLPAKSP